jgi:hypothetical protein
MGDVDARVACTWATVGDWNFSVSEVLKMKMPCRRISIGVVVSKKTMLPDQSSFKGRLG